MTNRINNRSKKYGRRFALSTALLLSAVLLAVSFCAVAYANTGGPGGQNSDQAVPSSPGVPEKSVSTEEKFHRYVQDQAHKGDPVEEGVLAREYVYGSGSINRDWAEAAKWYRKVAEQGFAEGAYGIGSLYQYGGPNLPQDWEEAYFWFSVASNNPVHDPDAPGQRDDAAKHLTPEQLTAVQKRVNDWKSSGPQLTNATKATTHSEKPTSTNSLASSTVQPSPFPSTLSVASMPAEARARHEKDCPVLSQLKKVAMQVPPRSDGKPIQNNNPVVLNVPIAYLPSVSRESDITEFLEVEADYDTLQPFCVKGWPDARSADRLGLMISRGATSQAVIDAQKHAVTNPKHWQHIADAARPEYDHYYEYRDLSEQWHILLPKLDILGTPYLISCKNRPTLKPLTPERTEIGGACELWFDYRHELSIRASFTHTHLTNLPALFGKTQQLLDAFASKERKL